MTHIIRLVLILTLCWSFATTTVAQPIEMTKSTHKALNNYIIYTNEVVHASYIMWFDFVYINESFNDFLEGDLDSLRYQRAEILRNYDYFPVLPNDLYQNIFDDNIFLPYSVRGVPLELIGKVNNLVTELENIRRNLHQYINSDEYFADGNLLQGYEWLDRVAVLYWDLVVLEEKLAYELDEIHKSYTYTPNRPEYQPIFEVMQDFLVATFELTKGIRQENNGSDWSDAKTTAQNTINQLLNNKLSLLKYIPEEPESSFCPHKRYNAFIDQGNSFLYAINDYENKANQKYTDNGLRPVYQYYNNEILNTYNRYGNGIVAVYNNMLEESNQYYLKAFELPVLFETNNSTIEEPKDSVIDVESPSFEGVATNNLVFLLDISSSMEDEEKLPLLKTALIEMLNWMRPEDNITIITYSKNAQVLLPPTSAQQIGEITTIISNLEYGTVSNANVGIEMAYEVVEGNFIEGGNNRIILATDGNFKLDKKTERQIQKSKKEDISLSVFYFSPQEYPTPKENLQALATMGGGRYSYMQRDNVSTILLEEARAVRKKDVDD